MVQVADIDAARQLFEEAEFDPDPDPDAGPRVFDRV